MNETASRRDGTAFFSAFVAHTKCNASVVRNLKCEPGKGEAGFFSLDEIRLFGKTNLGVVKRTPEEPLPQIESEVIRGNGGVTLPFNPDELIDNLRREKFVAAANGQISYVSNNQSLARKIYYA